MLKIVSILGARPQFIKHVPIELAFKGVAELITVHTGQHYDEKMSKVFFDQLGLSKPKYRLELGALSHGKQTGRMLEEIESILILEKPDFILLYGDTNSTLAGALAASKLHIKVIHVEAGLRSFNKQMPEEVNRVLTDHLSSYLFAPTQLAVDNLKTEGIMSKVFNVGDVMCDMAEIIKDKLNKIDNKEDYYLATIHRPYNTDEIERLKLILNEFNALDKKVIFPMHPRTVSKCKEESIVLTDYLNIEIIEPQPYLEMMNLLNSCSALITDSGGMQKEAYLFEKKCITIRSETEWIETLQNGWNTLVFEDLSQIQLVLKNELQEYIPNLYGDGKASEKIRDVILNVA